MKPYRSQIAWVGPSWRFRIDTYLQPDGSMEEKGVVEHPGSVVLAPMMDDRVIMLQQYRSTLGQQILELPAGTRGWNEPWLACAQRELREETGYRAGEFIPLGEVWPAPGLSSERMAIFLARQLSRDPLPADFDEEIVLMPMLLAELVSMAHDGRLQDAKSVVAVLRLANYLQSAD
jgi:ADP-ribose pyrophosphatase